MKQMDLGGLISGLNTVLKGLQDIAPVAEKLGLPVVVANVATIGIAATGTIQNILERGEANREALATGDETKLRAMLSDLQAVNDRLAGTIAEDATAEAPSGAGGAAKGGGGGS
jgi:hypothetical protein